MVLALLFTLVSAQQPPLPAGCLSMTFPDEKECFQKNWFLGNDAKDSCAPPGPYPIPGQQVYIQDPANFCMILPDSNSTILKNNYYSMGMLPTIVAGEGYAQSYCMGSYMTPGSYPMNKGGIRSAHVITGLSKNGKSYIQISGTFDCPTLGVNCTSTVPGAYDDGGQYDSVKYINCGKEPYSGVDASKHPKYVDYVQQAGAGLFCMRICEAGLEQNDPCNVKDDTKGCVFTMGITTFNKPGFTLTDATTGKETSFKVDLPPIAPTSTTAGSSKTVSKTLTATTTSKNSAFTNTNSGVVGLIFGLLALM